MKILLAVDGSVYSDAAIDEIVKRPWPSKSEVKVITAVMPIILGVGPWAGSPDSLKPMEKAIRIAATDVIDRAVSKLKTINDKTLMISKEILQGPPGQVIVDEAEKWHADLIVMGSRGLSTWNRLLLGSVSSGVVHHATCSVEIVRLPSASLC